MFSKFVGRRRRRQSAARQRETFKFKLFRFHLKRTFLQIPNLVECCVVNILNPNAALADPWSMILSNISRPESLAERVYIDCESKIDNLVSAFVNTNFNTKKCHLNYLAPIFSNLTQVSQARNQFCRNTEILSRLLPFVSYEDSVVRKGGVIGVLKNICFNTKLHDFLLTEIDVLPMILLPLTGPEDFTEEENEMFPIDLQVSQLQFVSSFEIS